MHGVDNDIKVDVFLFKNRCSEVNVGEGLSPVTPVHSGTRSSSERSRENS